MLSFAFFERSFGINTARILRVAAVTGAALALEIVSDAGLSKVLAQGFFSNLFGPPPSPPPQYLPPPRIQHVPVALPKPQISTPREPRPQQSSGYRTMCVRLCDGFYWPISNSASRSRFTHDAEMCSSSCEAESKLFYVAANGDPAEMVDLQGRAYSKLPTAFRYRKAMDDSCRCKPRPWDKTELDRHRRYAEAEAAKNASKLPQPQVKDVEAKPADPATPDPTAAELSKVPATTSEPAETIETSVKPTEAAVVPPAPPAPPAAPKKKLSPLQALIEDHRRQTRANVTVTYVRKPANSDSNVARKSQ